MEQICLYVPDYIVTIYRSVTSGGLLSFFGLVIALLIPFAIFIINNNNRTDEEKDFARVERAVILNKVMHVPFLVVATFFGGLASLLFIDNVHCNTMEIIHNLVMCVIIIAATVTIMWIIKDTILWIKSSAKPDTIDSFCFKKWKEYLEKIDDKDFYDTWSSIFGNKKLSAVLQPAYLSIFFDKIEAKKSSEKFIKYRILCENLKNIKIHNPGVLEILVNGVDLDYSGITLLNMIRDNCGLAGDYNLLMDYIDKKVQDNQNNESGSLIVKDFLFDGIRYFFKDEKKEREFVNAIPPSWKLNSLLQSAPQVMSKAMAVYYPEIMQYLLDKQNEKNIGLLEHINIALIGGLGNADIDERLLADICEIYGSSYRIIPLKDGQTLEQKLIEDYLKIETRYFANSNMYTVILDSNGKLSSKQSEKIQETNAIKILINIFPKIITDKTHIKEMQKEIKKQLTNSPNDYRLNRLSKIYNSLLQYASKA